MDRKQIAIMDKARSRRQRRAKTKSAGKAARSAEAQRVNRSVGLVDQAIDLAQKTVTQAEELVLTVAAKIAGRSNELSPPEPRKPLTKRR